MSAPQETFNSLCTLLIAPENIEKFLERLCERARPNKKPRLVIGGGE
jgi:hypothetical protein